MNPYQWVKWKDKWHLQGLYGETYCGRFYPIPGTNVRFSVPDLNTQCQCCSKQARLILRQFNT